MTSQLRVGIAIALLMFVAAATSIVMRPAPTSDQGLPIDLHTIIPSQFGSWRELPQQSAQIVNPQQKELIDKIYDQTLSRSYVNGQGRTVMLSIAYGGVQSGRLKVHRPESCYSGQGFLVNVVGEASIRTVGGVIPTKRLTAKAGNRSEPISYWIRVGNSTVTSLFGQRLAQFMFAMSGEIPDGLLFRVSSLGLDNEKEYLLHDQFVGDLMTALPKEHRLILARPTE